MKTFFKWGARIAPLLPLFAALFLAPQSRAQQNNQIFPTGPIYTLSGLIWGQVGGAFGFNNNWVFTPTYNGNSCITVAVQNNNPTNNHTFNVVLVQTAAIGNPAPFNGNVAGPQGWFQVSTSGPTSGSAFASANGAGGSFVYTLHGSVVGTPAQLALSLFNGATQAGSPDTATVTIIQSQGSCNLVQNAAGQQPNTPGTISSISNVELTSVANTAVSASTPLNTNLPMRGALFMVNARCSAGTAQLTIKDGAAQIFSTAATEVGTVSYFRQWNPGLTSSLGNQLTVTLGTCGAANIGTLDIQSSGLLVEQ